MARVFAYRGGALADPGGEVARTFDGRGPLAILPPTSGTAPNGLPYLNWDQVAAQLNRDGPGWNTILGAPVTLTYGFRSTAPTTMPEGTSGFVRFNAAQIQFAEQVLQLWADVANVTFVRQGSGTTGESAYTNNATILFANYTSAPFTASAFAFLPTPGATASNLSEGDLWVDYSDTYNSNPVVQGFGPHVLTHEIGHTLGLTHPGIYNGHEGGSPTYGDDAEYWQDTKMFTVMSYFDESPTGGSAPWGIGPLLHDIAAVQRLYGANMNTRTGDTIYGFNSNTGRANLTIASAAQTVVFAIWDAGGTDTLDLSGYNTSAQIDLREEAFSSAGPGSIYNISIARGAVIENAFGGSGNDGILGNAAHNLLGGLGGADTIDGAGGNDYLDGGAGADVLRGGLGNDAFVFDDAGDAAEELSGEGADVVYAHVSVNALGANIENLVLLSAAINGFGNGGANVVVGNAQNNVLAGFAGADLIDAGAGNDYLDGGAGADTLRGGLGHDSYVIDAASDVIVEAAGEGTDTVFAHVSVAALGANIENLLLLSAAALNGFGNELANAVTGNGQNNTLAGLGGADVLDGGAGADYLDGGTGADTLRGGLGHDSFVLDAAGDVIVEAAGEGTDTVFAHVSVTALAANVENLWLLSSATAGFGNTLANTITGNGLANTLAGLGGADVIEAGDGNDYVDGGAGADLMRGGLGNDSFVVDEAGDQLVETAGQGTDTVFAYVSITALADQVENVLLLGAAADAAGNGLANALTGNSLANVLDGAAGNDLLEGGLGADTLTGGADNDSFVFRAGQFANGQQDAITDFEALGAGENDAIRFFGISSGAVSTSDVSGGALISIDLGGGETATIFVANQSAASLVDDIIFG